MLTNSLFERNLLSLSLRHKELSVRLSNCAKSVNTEFKDSRTGLLVPMIKYNGRDFALHSLFDPIKEGKRYSESVHGGGYIVIFGMGACYHIKGLLERNDINGILIIDKDITVLKAILLSIDLSDILSDARITILIDETIESIKEFLLSSYLPAVMGDFQTIYLRSRVETEKNYFNEIGDSIKDILDALSDDYTVQTWFGKKWFINSLANLEAAQNSTTIIPPAKKVLIAAAGPSLDIQLDDLIKRRKESFLISTDTALPSLMSHSIKPDLVISIDCQQITYHHFMAGYPEDVPLVLDLASPSFLTRLTDKTFFFTSGHPFSKYINRNWRQFPFIDTSGGNVTHAALSLADSLGAAEIYLYGTDFSYPEGKSYARGTYIYPYFGSRAVRTSGIDSNFYNFLHRNENINLVKTDYGFRYTTRPMLSYRERLEKFSANVRGRIIPVPGQGEKLEIIQNPNKHTSNFTSFFSAGKSRSSWYDFLENYRKKILDLPEPAEPLSLYFSMLDFTVTDIWTTLFPIAAVYRKKYRNSNFSSSEILRKVRLWALEATGIYLNK